MMELTLVSGAGRIGSKRPWQTSARRTQLMAAALTITVLVSAPVRAQDTRAGLIQKQREEQAAKLQPYRRSKVEAALRRIEDQLLVQRIFNPPNGLFLRLGGFTEGGGFGGGPAYRISNPRGTGLTVSGEASLKGYWIAEAIFSAPDLARGHLFAQLAARRRDFPQEDYYGIGPDSKVTNRTNFALRETAVQGILGVNLRDPVRPAGAGLSELNVSFGTRIAYLAPSIGRGTDKRFQSTELLFSSADTPGLVQQPDFAAYEGFVDVDFRSPKGNPSGGGRYTLTASRYDDRDFDRYSFRRVEIDAQQYVNLAHRHRVLVLRALVSLSDPDGGHAVPFYFQRTLGGAYTIRGFRSFRFRDRNLMLLQAEYRYEINRFMTGAVFYDAGKVAARRQDLDFENLDKSYGVGFRVGSQAAVSLRAEVALGSGEGTRWFVRFNNVF